MMTFNGIVIVPDNRTANGAEKGIAIAGIDGTATPNAFGTALSGNNGVAIAGYRGHAIGGNEALAFAGNGGNAECVGSAVAWTTQNGPAKVGDFGVAVTLDGDATVSKSSIAFALSQNGKTTNHARGGPSSVAVVRTHPADTADRKPAVATAGKGGIAIAYGNNYVSGSEEGALLVVVSEDKFVIGVVGENDLVANEWYHVKSGALTAVAHTVSRRRDRRQSSGRPKPVSRHG